MGRISKRDFIVKSMGKQRKKFFKMKQKRSSINELARQTSTSFFDYLSQYIINDNVRGLKHALTLIPANSIDDENKFGITCLMVAAIHNRTECTDILLEHKANPNREDDKNRTPLIAAARKGHTSMCAILLDNGAFINHKDKSGFTALLWAVYRNHEETVIYLLDRGASKSIGDNYKMTPLIYASGRGFDTIVAELVKRGAKVNSGDKYSTTPLIWACRGGHEEIVELLLEAGANVDVVGMYGWTALIIATKIENLAIVLSLLMKKPNLNIRGEDNRTALHTACRTGSIEIGKALMAAGANLNLQDDFGYTPLIYAVKLGNLELVHFLLHFRADVNLYGLDRKTPVYIAVETRNIDILKLLLTKRPDLETVANNGSTPFLRAVRSRDTEIVKILMKNGAKVFATVKGTNDNALHIAIRARSRAVTELLLSNPQHSQMLYRSNKKGETPYKIDVSYKHPLIEEIFGSYRLNELEKGTQLSTYELYTNTLADVLCQPTLSLPITVGLYAKWGSGRSFLLSSLKDSMVQFSQNVYHYPLALSALLMTILAHICLTIGSIMGLILRRWFIGLIIGIELYLTIVFLVGILILINWYFQWRYVYKVMTYMGRKLRFLYFVVRVLFMHPIYDRRASITKPVRFLFTNQKQWSHGAEDSMVNIINTLYEEIENTYGQVAIKVYRALRPPLLETALYNWKLRKMYFIPTICLVEVWFACFHIILCAITYLFQSGLQKKYCIIIIAVTGSIMLILMMFNIGAIYKVLVSLFISQSARFKRKLHKTDVIKSEGAISVLLKEVKIMEKMLQCLDCWSHHQSRLTIIIDELDSCEVNKELNFLDNIQTLFLRPNGPFIILIAFDPQVIVKTVEDTCPSLFGATDLNGYDYIKCLINIPVYLEGSRIRLQKLSILTAREMQQEASLRKVSSLRIISRSVSGDIHVSQVSEENSIRSTKESSTEKNLMRFQNLASTVRLLNKSKSFNNMPTVSDIHTKTQTINSGDDYFSEVNPTGLRSLRNILYVTGRLLKANKIQFNWYHLACWVNITQQWPYRVSWIIFYWSRNLHLANKTPLSDIYDKIRLIIPQKDPLLHLDKDGRKFDIYLTYHRFSLILGHLKIFLAFTINLDPHIQKKIQKNAEKLKIPGFLDSSLEDLGNDEYANRYGTILPKFLLKKRLSSLTVDDICDLFDEVDKIYETTLQKHKNTIQQQNIKGKVLLVCNLDELRGTMGMNFGDWEIFRLMILELRMLQSKHSEKFYGEEDASLDSPSRSSSLVQKTSTEVETPKKTRIKFEDRPGSPEILKQDTGETSTTGQDLSLPSISIRDRTQSSVTQTQDSGYPSADRLETSGTQTAGPALPDSDVTRLPVIDDEILGNVSGEVTGEVTGRVSGRMLGRVSGSGPRGKGRVHGRISGTMSGRLFGRMEGAVNKKKQFGHKKK